MVTNGPRQRLEQIQRDVVACSSCPRLIAHCRQVALVKRRAYRDWEYWGKPVPSFGDPHARVLLVGLAPAAHGANRTGRMFTGDRSGEFLYRALYDTGFASQPSSVARGDGLTLKDVYITAAVRCAPPANRPTPGEIRACRAYLVRELDVLRELRIVVALGRIAFDATLAALRERGAPIRSTGVEFGHDREHALGPGLPLLISSYHPSQQNTSTGRLTREMLNAVFQRVRHRLTG